MTSARDIAAAVSMTRVLDALGILHDARRADCPLCDGRSRRTASISERLYHCHRCHAGGDVYALVQRVHGRDFRAALRFVAAVGGLPLPAGGANLRAQLAERKRERERVERAKAWLEHEERELRIAHAGCVRELDALARRTATQNRDGRHDELLAALPALIRRDAAAYALLAFAGARARAKYVLQPTCRRRAADAVLAGLVRDDAGHVVEVAV